MIGRLLIYDMNRTATNRTQLTISNNAIMTNLIDSAGAIKDEIQELSDNIQTLCFDKMKMTKTTEEDLLNT